MPAARTTRTNAHHCPMASKGNCRKNDQVHLLTETCPQCKKREAVVEAALEPEPAAAPTKGKKGKKGKKDKKDKNDHEK
ncbi:hypothetical protein G7046_g4347 [Stylonectria norvegica]|nr:hypothetical protein G7046_g4347 [Stylonectria norvegica]